MNGFLALSDPTRRQIFELLNKKPLSVGNLAMKLPVSRPAVSQHLKVLKDAGLVVSKSEGTKRLYQIDPKGIAAMRQYLDRFWDQALAAFKLAAEGSED